MKKNFAPLLSVLATSMLLASCGGDKTATTETVTTANPADSVAAIAGDSARMAKPEGVMVDGVDVIDQIQANDEIEKIVVKEV